MGIDRAPVGDDEALRPQRFKPEVIGPGRDRAFDACGQQLLEGGEQNVLQVDREREQLASVVGRGSRGCARGTNHPCERQANPGQRLARLPVSFL
jgi:hypothetical protein